MPALKSWFIRLFPLVVFIFLAICTFFAWKVSKSIVRAEIEQRFNQEVLVSRYWIQDRLNLYLPIVLGIRIFSESSDKITAIEWSNYIRELKLLDNYPAISSLTYIERGSGNAKDTYLIKFVEPMNDVNKKSIGFNLSGDQKRLDLLNSVRDENPTSKGRITLIATPQKGFDIILPVYRKGSPPITIQERRNTLKGFVQVRFEGSRLFQDIFDVIDSINLSFEVYSSAPSKENLLYDRGLDYSAVLPNFHPEISTNKSFEFNGQDWHLIASTKPNYKLTPSQEALPIVVLGGGITFSLIFLGVFLYLNKTR